MKKIFVYQTTNLVNGMIYIGVHTTSNIDDGYLGSGKYLNAAINKYGRDSFVRTIIKYFDNEEDAYLLEKIIVDEDFITREDTYNLVIGGRGGWCDTIKKVSDEKRKEQYRKISAALKGKPKSVEARRRMSEAQRRRQASKPIKQKYYSSELRATMSREMKELGFFTDETKKRMSEESKQKANHHNNQKKQKYYSPDLRATMSREMKELGCFTDETKKRLGEEARSVAKLIISKKYKPEE